MATQSVATVSVRPCVMTTPLGTPVVPDVKRMSDGSSGPERGAAAPDVGQGLRRRARHEVAPRHGAVGCLPLGHDNGLEGRQGDAGACEHGHVVGAQEVGDGHEHAGPAPGEDVRRLGALEARVHRDEDRARGEEAERGDDPLGAVPAPDRHTITGLDPGLDQRGAERRHASASSA